MGMLSWIFQLSRTQYQSGSEGEILGALKLGFKMEEEDQEPGLLVTPAGQKGSEGDTFLLKPQVQPQETPVEFLNCRIHKCKFLLF